MSTITSLCDFKARVGVSDTSSDAVLQSVLDGAERAAVVYLGYDPSSAAATEYYSGDGSEFIVLRRKPVTTVTSVYEDAGGRYGVPSGSFDATATLLTAGTDYSVRTDGGSQAGILVRHGAFWPYSRRRPVNRLGWELSPEFGSVKVVYTSGYTPTQLADIAEAIYLESAGRWVSRATGMGPFQSESLDGYSRSLGSGSSSSESVSNFVSPLARDMLRMHRLTPLA